MKYRYQITATIGIRDVATGRVILPHEPFVTLYDSPEELNFLNPVHKMLMKRVATICFEMSLLENDQLKDLGMQETRTQILLIDQEYVKQIRNKKDELS